MAAKYREEIVGKRFLSVRSATKLKTSKLSEWEWRSGVIRAVTHKDTSNVEFTVLVEFDDCEWKRREWIRVHEIFQVFLVEFTLVWAPRSRPIPPPDPDSALSGSEGHSDTDTAVVLWPAISFQIIVDKSGFRNLKLRATEYVDDHGLEFLEDSTLKYYKVEKFEDDDTSVQSPARSNNDVSKAVRRWLEQQDGQSILLTTPSVLVGYRVEVYCAEGTRQWYTAVIHSYNEKTRELRVTDDTVLELHTEDPSLVQIKLIGDGVVESILKGENLGITPRRRSCNIRNAHRDTETSLSTSILARLNARTRSQSPSQSCSPAGVQKNPSAASRAKGRQKAAQCSVTSVATTAASAASAPANHGLPSPVLTEPATPEPAPTANPPQTAPAKDEKEKPPDRGKTRTSQRERKRRSEDVSTPPPSKQKPTEKDKDDKEKKVYKELTRNTSVKAGSILPASTQPTVVVKQVRTQADHTKLVRETTKDVTKSPKATTNATTPRARKAKDAQKETKEPQPNRTGSPASGVRSRTPKKDKEEKIKIKSKQQTSPEKPINEQKRKTRERLAKGKEAKRESKRLKEDIELNDGNSIPASPSSSTSSACSSATSRLEVRSLASTPPHNADSVKRVSPATTKPIPFTASSSNLDLKSKDSALSQTSSPLSDNLDCSDRLQGSLACVSPTPLPVTVSSLKDNCTAERSSNQSKPTANIDTTESNRTLNVSVSNYNSNPTNSCSSSNSSPCKTNKGSRSSTCSTEVTATLITTTTTTTTKTVSCTPIIGSLTTTISSTSTSSSATVNPIASPLQTLSNSPNASSQPSTISRDSQNTATALPSNSSLKTGLEGSTRQRGRSSPSKGVAAHQSSNSSVSCAATVGNRQSVVGSGGIYVASSTLPLCSATLTSTGGTTAITTTIAPTRASTTVQSSPSLSSPVTASKSCKTTEGTLTSVSLRDTSLPVYVPLQSTASSSPLLSSSASSSFHDHHHHHHHHHHQQRGGPLTSMSHISSRSTPLTPSKQIQGSGRCDPNASSSTSCSSASPLVSSGSSLASSVKSSRPDEEPAMHYKKMILLDGYHKKEASSTSAASPQKTFTAASGINVNHSLTDQIAKLSNFKAWNNNDSSTAVAANPSLVPPTAGVRGSADFPRDNRQLSGIHGEHIPIKKKPIEHTGHRVGSVASHPQRQDKSGKLDEPARNSVDRESNRIEMERRELELRERLTSGHPSEERSHSRSSADERHPSRPSSSASNSRVEELWRSAGSDAHAASPLIFDKNEPIRVYRDPELLKRDEMRYLQQRQQQEQHSRHAAAAAPTAVPPSASFQPGHPSPLGSPHHAAAALPQQAGQRSLLTQHHYGTHMNALTQHMSMSPHSIDPATLRVLSTIPGAMYNPLMQQYMHSTNQLELLWQQKYPTLPVPPAWMLVQYQEELLRDVNLIAIERDRRDREIAIERERVEQAERERAAERERRERERAAEREREALLERERKHREEAERGRKREEAERQERERVEKERKEQERLKREQREQCERGHILKETAQAQAAVDQHFTESLRLASQKQAAGAVPWPTGAPSITHGLPKHPPVMAVPPEALAIPAQHHSAFTHRVIPQPHQVAPRDHLPQKKEEKMGEDRREQPSPHHHDSLRSQQEALRHSEEKRHQTLQQENILRHQIMMEKGAAADHHSSQHPKYPPGHHLHTTAQHQESLTKQYSMYTYPPKTVSSMAPGAPAAAMSTNSSSGSSSSSSPGMTSSGHAMKQEANYSLYGYQPFQPSGIQYISKETLYNQGLKDDKGVLQQQQQHHHSHLIKEEPKGHIPAIHSHMQRTASPHGPLSKGAPNQVSPPPLIKDAKPGSVIVENKPKDADIRQHASDRAHTIQHVDSHRASHGLPPPAHSHHGVSGSITLGTALSPHQQTKGLEGRPAYGGHPQSRPACSPHPGHPSHIHSLPPVQCHHSVAQQQNVVREHNRSSPHTSLQIPAGAVMQPMDLHKHASSSGAPGSSMPTREPRPQTHPQHTAPAGYLPSATAQPPVSLQPKSPPAAHSYNLIQEGLVPNPIYSRNAQGVAGSKDPTAATALQQSSQHQHSPPSTGQKRRSPKDIESLSGGTSSEGPVTHHKKSRIVEAMAASHTSQPTVGLNSASSTCAQHAQPKHEQAAIPQPSQSARTTAPSSTSTGYMDSFRSFVEKTVQSAFYQDQEMSATKALQQHNQTKSVPNVSHVMSTQASPMPSTVSVSSPQAMCSSKMTPSTTSTSPFATSPTTQAMPPATMLMSSALQQGVPPPSSSPANTMGNSVLPYSSLPVRPGPASTPGGASVSSTSSIVDTINRVANGYVESDSDTLSAPSPPPQRADVTPSPTCRPGNHKAFKKAWLQRYSDEDKEKDTALCPPVNLECTTPPVPDTLPDGGKAGDPVKECYVNCSYISPTKEGGSKSPISLIAKDFRKGDEDSSTSSASESESQVGSDGTAKRRMKTARRRRSSGSTGNKKPKLEVEEEKISTPSEMPITAEVTKAPSALVTTTTSSTASTTTTQQQTTGGKKRFSRKGREGVKDSTNKGLSDDEAVKDRMENDAKPRQVLHNQHHSKQSSTNHLKAEVKKEITNTTNTTVSKTNTPLIRLDMIKQEKVEEKPMSDKPHSRSRTPTTMSAVGASVNNVNAANSPGSASNVSTTSSKGKKSTAEVSDNESTPKENKKRGRKPRENKKNRDATPPRTENLSAILASKPLNKTALVKLKKTLEPFIQDSACPEIAPKLMKCRECKLTNNQRNKKIPNIFCRFYAFRRLRYNQKSILAIAGFSEPSDADGDDIELWMPRLPVAPPHLDVSKAKYLIQHVGDQFCELVEQEKEAMSWVSPDTKVAWKRAVQGVREMCDVCDTTLFNMHWACHKCGFVVCIDCYRQRTRKLGSCMDANCKSCDNIGAKWLTCSTNRQPHEADKLMITQIIPSDALWAVGRMIHEVRDKWKIRSNCPCGRTKDLLLPPKNGVTQLLTAAIKNSPERDGDSQRPLVNGNSGGNGEDGKLFKNQATSVNGSPPGSLSPLSLLANVASMDSENSRDKKILNRMKEALEFGSGHYNPLEDGKDGDEKSPANCSTLRELLTKTAGRMKPNPENKKSKTTLDDIIQQVVERNLPKDSDLSVTPILKHYIPKNGSTALSGREFPIRCYTLTETSVMYPDVPHSWLDNGRLLRLNDPRNKGNMKLWQQQWRRGQPVLVSNCHKRMTRNLWLPDTFSREFGEIENDLVNCVNGLVICGHQMKYFWDGFSTSKNRLKDEKGRPMILKLKDWPPTEDFSEILPGRFHDLMNGIPLPEYTHRTGIYNMASRLPDFFVRPDLGPKMYNAYGSAFFPHAGTTNLHLDISDAVNTIVFVGITSDDEDMDHAAEAFKALDEAGCDNLTKQRIKENDEAPGALWHIFDALDADKIRDMLNKIAKERGEVIEPHHDPIHDQSWYLDEGIRKRLLEEYNVQGYTILQCLGDAVFIPAGAPHQVRNLHSCIKVAEDFVSPENVSYCFKMTQEFRHLTDTHSNHEDKLQIKNIIYHTVKDAVAVLREAHP